MGSQSYTLREAAEKLGVRPHTLRMRWKRGQVEGYTLGGRINIYVDDTSQPSPEASQPSLHSEPEGVNSVKEAIDAYEIELQTRELARLRTELATAKSQVETERSRYDEMMADNRRTRESEAVLRSQLQNIVLKFEERPALAAPDPARLDQLEEDNRMLKTGVVDLVGYIKKQQGGR
jgi:DNA-binding transcriptional MerR regulator